MRASAQPDRAHDRAGRWRTRRVVALVVVVIALAGIAVAVWPRGPAPVPPSAAASTPPPVQGEDAPVAVFIGDSYTVGAGTSLRGSGFPAMLGELRGWRVVNLAISGTGYATSRDEDWCPRLGCRAYGDVIPFAVDASPDIVVVSGGRNDFGQPRAQLERAVVDFFSDLRAALPDARVIVTSPLWHEAPTPEWLTDLRGIVAREAARAGAEHVDLGDLFLDRTDLIASDGLHPSEAGLELIASRIDAMIAAD